MSSRRSSVNPARRRDGGVILIITLLAIVLLMALILWVINIGEQVNHRVVTQNAADATAQAGASWMARQMNTVANNNMEMARLIAAINVLDSMPQAVDFTYREDVSLRDSLEGQLARGISVSPSKLREAAMLEFNKLYDDLTLDIEDLQPVLEFFQQQDVSVMTFYAEDGHLWRALAGLDEMNTAVIANMGSVAQTAAVNAGLANFGSGDHDQAAAMLPANATLPTERGRFNDFLLPVLQGLPPEDIDDRVIRRGPWDAMLGWRRIHYETINTGGGGGGSGGTPGSRQIVNGGNAGNPFSRTESSNGTGGGGGGGTRVEVAYSTWGPYRSLVAHMTDYGNSRHDTVVHRPGGPNLSYYLNRISDVKFNYLWPGSRPRRLVIDPDWRIDFNEAKDIARRLTPRIRESAYFIVEFKSQYPRTDGRFMTPGTFGLVSYDNAEYDAEAAENAADSDDDGSQRLNPRIQLNNRWIDMDVELAKAGARGGTNPLSKLNSHVWMAEYEYQLYSDPAIGIFPEFNADGSPVVQTAYRVDIIAFAGANVGEPVDVRNPYEGFNPLSDAAPAPTDLRHDELEYNDEAARWQRLSVLGMARRDDVPQGWQSRFRGGRPAPYTVGIAQAKVFNNHSWDLWTPMWRAELEPVSHYDDWLAAFNNAGDVQSSAAKPEEFDAFYQYLQNASQLADVMLTH